MVLLAVRPARERFALVKPAGRDTTDPAAPADPGVGGDDTADDRAHRVHVTTGPYAGGHGGGIVVQERGSRPYRERHRVLRGAYEAAQAAGSPSATPKISNRTALRMTIPITRPRGAPRAIRIPISLVRLVTL